MTHHDMRDRTDDMSLVNSMDAYGVTSIDRLQAVADFGKKWAFRMHLDGRLCGIREIMVMESSNPARHMLTILQALQRLHDDEHDSAQHAEMGDGNEQAAGGMPR